MAWVFTVFPSDCGFAKIIKLIFSVSSATSILTALEFVTENFLHIPLQEYWVWPAGRRPQDKLRTHSRDYISNWSRNPKRAAVSCWRRRKERKKHNKIHILNYNCRAWAALKSARMPTHTGIHTETIPAVLYSLVRWPDSCLGREFPMKLIFHCIQNFHSDETVPWVWKLDTLINCDMSRSKSLTIKAEQRIHEGSCGMAKTNHCFYPVSYFRDYIYTSDYVNNRVWTVYLYILYWSFKYFKYCCDTKLLLWPVRAYIEP